MQGGIATFKTVRQRGNCPLYNTRTIDMTTRRLMEKQPFRIRDIAPELWILLLIVVVVLGTLWATIKQAEMTAIIWNECNPNHRITTADAWWIGPEIINCEIEVKSND